MSIMANSPRFVRTCSSGELTCDPAVAGRKSGWINLLCNYG